MIVNGKKVSSQIGGLSSKKPWKGYKRGGKVKKADGGPVKFDKSELPPEVLMSLMHPDKNYKDADKKALVDVNDPVQFPRDRSWNSLHGSPDYGDTYADGGEIPDVGEPLIGSGGTFSEGSPWANKAADIGGKLGGSAAISAATLLPRYIKATVDAAKQPAGSEEAHEAYGDVGDVTGEMGMNMIGPRGGPKTTAGVFVGPWGAHMLRDADRGAVKPHPVIGEEIKQRASSLRPEFQNIYKSGAQDLRDAQARGVLEARQGSLNPQTDRDVFNKSGWSYGPAGDVTKEIPDIGAKLVPLKGTNKFVLDHPAGDFHKLYEVPPIEFDPKMKVGNGGFNPETNQITIGGYPSEKNLKASISVVLHEIQHAIQKKEGMAHGANPYMARERPEVTQEFFPEKGAPEELIHRGGGTSLAELLGISEGPKRNAHIPSWHEEMVSKQASRGEDPFDMDAAIRRAVFETYRKSAGETQSRNVQDRRAKSYRYGMHPADTEDVTRGLQWVDDRNKPRARKDIQIEELRAGAIDKESQEILNNIYGAQGKHYIAKAGGGEISSPPWFVKNEGRSTSGMLKSSIPGRTDKIPLQVGSGSYVLPADIPSALGQGNTMAGGSILDKMFNKGPYGMNLPRSKSGMSTKMGRMSSLTKVRKSGYADGGDVEPTDIIAAGGEYVLTPEQVAHVGGGNMDAGHNILDAFVKQVRNDHIKTLRKLPGPKKD